MGLRSMVRVKYTLDTGTVVAIKQMEQDRAAAGNVLADGSEAARPDGLTPRVIHAHFFADGGPGQPVGSFARKVAIGVVTNPLWTHATTVISLPNFEAAPGVGQLTPNAMVNFQVTSRHGEILRF